MSAIFKAICTEQLADPQVAVSRMFGGECLKVSGKVFAMEFKGSLVVKLSKERAQELVSCGEATVFDPGHGRPMKQWIAVAPDSTLEWTELAREAKSAIRP